MNRDQPHWEPESRVYPVQFNDEKTARPRGVRLSCAAMRAGDPVEILDRGNRITGTISGIISSVVHVTRERPPVAVTKPLAEAEPSARHVATFWTLRGPSGPDLTCAAFVTEHGLELRAGYSADDVVSTELFRGDGADDRLAEKADAWRLALRAKGMREIAG